ncbi:MAG: hypothetical protein A3E01_19310 [Gammaproteobacteria bacterium RIFCSPHIGHO2_12_FULL_63_22]|nr:MAG: hypothetical protein A3E01_19310 [Gammaproteobacteria bacterium RIFCSPHIGHO2_12_FULL_63_22]
MGPPSFEGEELAFIFTKGERLAESGAGAGTLFRGCGVKVESLDEVLNQRLLEVYGNTAFLE